jgi:predicted nucleic acid-binding protein
LKESRLGFSRMSINPKTVYWDTSCFIARFNGEPDRIEVCNAIIEAAKREELKLYTSYLTMCEWAKIKGEYASEAEDQIVKFLQNPYITLVAIDLPVSRVTRDLIRHYSLRLPDAIHLATAIKLKVDVFHTYDLGDLIKLNGKIPEVKVQISKPTFVFQASLPDQH